jgi:hypothetical protein
MKMFYAKPIEFTLNENGCHICTSHPVCGGYPTLKRNGKRSAVFRYVFQQHHNRSILKRCGKERIELRHKCDNKRCINPEHLILGTNHDNHMDMVERGLTAHQTGETNGRAKLTWEAVAIIRKDLHVSGADMARRFNVGIHVVSDVRHFKSWLPQSGVCE